MDAGEITDKGYVNQRARARAAGRPRRAALRRAARPGGHRPRARLSPRRLLAEPS